MAEHIDYDEFGLFHENAAEHGLPYDGSPTVRRESVEVGPGRNLSALVWGSEEPELVLLHGGSQNAHTWDTVAMALGRPLVAIDLPGHGHSDGPGPEARRAGAHSPSESAKDVAAAIRTLAPRATAVVGMSLGGLTLVALTAVAPELVRKVVLVDVTPGDHRERSRHIAEFVSGPPTFASFDELLERTIRFNPTRSVSSLRRGILHNAVQRDDGTWVWRWARWREQPSSAETTAETNVASAEAPAPAREFTFVDLWSVLQRVTVPVMLARGMLAQSVVGDEDEAELLRRVPKATVVHFDHAGHSIQGDMPVELAHEIEAFVFG